jgi:hypothetical protein
LAYRRRTPRCEVRVEGQSLSDMAITSHGKVRPTWIGTGRVPANAVSAARAF